MDNPFSLSGKSEVGLGYQLYVLLYSIFGYICVSQVSCWIIITIVSDQYNVFGSKIINFKLMS